MGAGYSSCYSAYDSYSYSYYYYYYYYYYYCKSVAMVYNYYCYDKRCSIAMVVIYYQCCYYYNERRCCQQRATLPFPQPCRGTSRERQLRPAVPRVTPNVPGTQK